MEEFEMYFRNIFKSEGWHGIEDQLECMSKLVGYETNNMLTRMVEREEVKTIIFQLRGNKVSGLDGFPGVFYHRVWDVLGDDVFNSVQAFFETSTLLPGFCYSDNILILKVPNPTNTTQFRPIRLCNFNYKIISKILVNRLKLILPSLITPFQSVFISGRLIHNNILIANEVLYHLRANKQSSRDECTTRN